MADPTARLADSLAGRYRIDREVGSGGMAVVYVAQDLKHHREVAIKVLRPQLTATLAGERFLREVEISARLTHPHILSLFDSGEAAGFLYYVMPYVQGETLRDKLAREGSLPPTEAARILRDVADGLGYAHRHGVLHRDIKPANILLADGHAMIADLGVAKAVTDAAEEDEGRARLTTPGTTVGTPAYMAPEQAAADPHLDPRADLYALGAVAYEMLTGQPPFTGATTQAVVAAHVSRQPQPLAVHGVAVPPALEAAIMRCLEKDPARRPESAAALLPILDAIAMGTEPPTAAPAAAARRMPWWPWIALGVAVVIIAVLSYLAFSNHL